MNISILKRVAITATFAAFIGNSAQANTYTAIASGNFSNAATWTGGNVPSSVLTTDAVIIPSGITVTLDQDQQLNGTLSNLIVDGTLTSSASTDNDLVLTAGTISGSGVLNVDSLVLGLSYGFGFTGTINAQKMVSLGSVISSNAMITVSSVLELHNALLALNSGSLSLAAGATIVMSGGTMSVGGGSMVSLTNNYNVLYTSTSATTGLELSGSGLTNVEVAVPASSAVSLGSDLTLQGMLTLTSGTLNTNDKDLFFTGNANVSATGSGTISGTSGSSISFASTNSFSGGLRFSSTGNTINNLTLNLGNNSNSIMLSSGLHVAGTLSLQAGRIDIGSNDLTVNGSVSGGSANSYVITGKNGHLLMSLAAGTTNMYYVGTGSNYAPAVIDANTGGASGMVGVSVNTSVFAEGYDNSGADLSQSQALVNATWYVTSTASSNIDLNLQTMWSANMEINGFDRSQLYLSHYTNANWDVAATMAAGVETNGLFSARRINITSLSPFAVMGKDAVTTSVGSVTVANKGIMVYPNPAINTLNISGNFHTARIYNLNGALVKTATITNNAILVEELPVGLYTMLVMGNNNTSATARFYKQ